MKDSAPALNPSIVSAAGNLVVNDSADVKAIEAAVQDYAKGYTAKDANAIASLMTDDVAFALANNPAVVGKEAVQKLLQVWGQVWKI